MGVKAITLDEGDFVVGMGVDGEGEDLLIITEKGYGKRTRLGEYRLQNRGGKGLIAANITDRNGNIAAVKVVNKEDEVMIISREGIIIRTEVSQISRIGRNTQGVKVMALEEGDRVVALAGIAPEDEDEGENIELEDIDIEDIDLQDSGLDDIELKDIELKDIEPEDNDLEDFTDID